MLEPAEVRREESTQVRHAVFQHGDTVDAEAEGEALIARRIEPDILEHVRMHHAAAENLEPLVAFADPDLVADFGVPDVHFHRWLGEREVARAEAHLHLRYFEERLAEFLEHPFQMPEMSLLVDGEPLDLVEHRRMRLVRVAAIDASRRDDAERRLLLLHGADLHRARMGAEHWPRAVRTFREIEGVVVLPRRMLGRNVERGEIIEVGLD